MTGILEVGRTCASVPRADRAGLLIDGRDYYRAAHAAIASARSYVLLAGWQLDSDVELLRGPDAVGVAAPTALADLLDWRCRTVPGFEAHVLAWRPHLLYALERTPFQRARFRWGRSDRLRFVWDGHHPVGASHHQKMLVVDGWLAFAGGMDLCVDRWDDRVHRPHDPRRRTSRGEAFDPYHDVQAFVTGAAASAVRDLFAERWRVATDGEALSLRDLPAPPSLPFEPTYELPSATVGVSLTRGASIDPPAEAVRQIEALVVTAIERADRTIYVENQYLTSDVVYDALVRRMSDTSRPLEVGLVLPRAPEALKEALALGVKQARLLTLLERAAREGRHRVAAYCVGGPHAATYIHAKVMIVDDELLVVGSNNLTNRSMGLDTELALAWEAKGDPRLREAIRGARTELLAEHCGRIDRAELARVGQDGALVSLLDEWVAAGCRLRRLDPEPSRGLTRVLPESVVIDPERAEVEEALLDTVRRLRRRTRVAKALWRLLARLPAGVGGPRPDAPVTPGSGRRGGSASG